METTLLVALSRQGALRRQMDVVANNLANMNTNGFKAERMLFTDHVVRSGGASGPSAPIAFVRDIATVRDDSPGRSEPTGNPLDLAIQGEGYFVVEGAGGELLYSRNGRLQLDGEGRLVTAEGTPVLTTADTPVLLGETDTEITVARDGTLSSENGELGKLRVVSFEAEAALLPMGGSLLSTEAQPVDVAAPVVEQGMLERSNVEPILEMEKMIRVERAYASVRDLINREDDRLKQMLQVYAA
jgi:flagellar basal-body rod protein FlgF